MGRAGVWTVRAAAWGLAVTGAASALRLSLGALEPVRDRARRLGSVAALPLPDLITAWCAAVLGAAVLWLLLVTVATVVEGATGRVLPGTRALTPALVRRLVLAGCGLAVVSATVSPASAAVLAPAPDAREGVTGLPLPDRTAGSVVTPPHLPRQSDHPDVAARTHRVRAGETLWSVAAALLPPGAPAQDVDATWRDVYRVNRGVVGADPDLLPVGTVLRLPAFPTPGDEPATPDRKDA